MVIELEIEGNEELLLIKLLRFYKTDNQHLIDLAAITSQKTIISLREMDFLVTKYSKKQKIIYNLPDGTLFNLNIDYKAQLDGHSKKRFDPFCRLGDPEDTSRLGRLFIDFETKTPIFLKDKTQEELKEFRNRTDGIVTNIGQMNFFRWAINNKVIEYCFNNKDKIVEVMDKEYKAKKEKKKAEKSKKEKKESELNKPNKTAVPVDVVIIQFP